MSINLYDIGIFLVSVFVGVKTTLYAIEKYDAIKREKLQKQIKVGEIWCLKRNFKNPFERKKSCVVILDVKEGFVMYKNKDGYTPASEEILTFARAFQKIEIKE